MTSDLPVVPDANAAFLQAYAAVGRLTAQWAGFESRLYGLLRRYLVRNDDELYPASYVLINGLRYPDVTNSLTRMLVEYEEPQEAKECLKDLLSLAAKAKRIRDLVAHREFNLSGDLDPVVLEFHLWNQKSLKAETTVHYSAKELEQCALSIFWLYNGVTELEKRLNLFKLYDPSDSRGYHFETATDRDASWREKLKIPTSPEEDPTRHNPYWQPPL